MTAMRNTANIVVINLMNKNKMVHFIFLHCGWGSPLGVRGKVWKKRKNEMHPNKAFLKNFNVSLNI